MWITKLLGIERKTGGKDPAAPDDLGHADKGVGTAIAAIHNGESDASRGDARAPGKGLPSTTILAASAANSVAAQLLQARQGAIRARVRRSTLGNREGLSCRLAGSTR